MILKFASSLKLMLLLATLALGVAAQIPVETLKKRITNAIAAADIQEALKTAAKSDLSESDVIDLRLTAHVETERRLASGSTIKQEKAKLAVIEDDLKKRLISDLEKYLARLETTTPKSPELSRTAVTLAQMLQKTFSRDSSAKKRAAFLREQSDRATSLYIKALEIERALSATSPDTLTITIFLADRYMRSAAFELALPLYEEYLKGVEESEGKDSAARPRALIELAKISEAAGDITRLDALKKELASLSITYNEGVDLSPRANPESKGVIDPGGSLKYHIDEGVTVRDRAGNMSPKAVETRLGPTQQIFRRTPTSSISSAKFSGGYPVLVTIDMQGNVVKAEPELEDSPKDQLISLVEKWKFRPLIYKGRPSAMKGIVYCWIVR